MLLRPVFTRIVRLIVPIIALALGLGVPAVGQAAVYPASVYTQPVKLPLAFMHNAAQSGHFETRNPGGSLSFTSDTITFLLSGNPKQSPAPMNLTFEGANPAANLTGENQLSGVVNDLIGSDPSRWSTAMPTYSAIRYTNLYPGVDLAFNGLATVLTGTFTVAAGADASVIGWHYDGTTAVQFDAATGDLQLILRHDSSVTLNAPVAWQTIDGTRVPVSVQYDLQDNHQISLIADAYNPAYPVTIDATIQYSTGVSTDASWGVTLDNQGYAYIAGRTETADLAVSSDAASTSLGGPSDIYVAKINTNGGANALVWATYLGGSRDEVFGGVAVDSAYNVYITGGTVSDDFPVTTSGFQQQHLGCCISDAFLTQLDPNGTSVLYSTYLGGTFADRGFAVAVDSAENAYVVGLTSSSDLPVTDTAYDPTNAQFHDTTFITKLNTRASGTASLLYATYFGGKSDANYVSHSIVVDDSGSIYFTGETLASDFPLTANAFQSQRNGAGDAFVTQMNTTQSGAASLVYSTYLGGSGAENMHVAGSVTADGTGKIYVTGETSSTDFPIVNGFDPSYGGDPNDTFVAAIDTAASGQQSLIYSTYLGGDRADAGSGLAYMGDGVISIIGESQSSDFPLLTRLDSPAQAYRGDFVTRINTLLKGSDSLVASSFADSQVSNLTLPPGA